MGKARPSADGLGPPMAPNSSEEAFGIIAFRGGASVIPLVDSYYRGGEQAMARALPCVSPHNGTREELPQAYVVSDLSAPHSALPWFWADTALIQAGTALVLGGHCLRLERALPCFGTGRRFPKSCGDSLMR